ncbi:polymorphic toxin type 15 domain-containing protein [Litorilituus sediminis]|uniref:Novel toxin 15 domain-containing protein n=1 Tax=Litorilituus sediminis TaxID=718192 RepID=A0A4P6P135_9GAMM|nr:polymorphic toxin type 15 domain-containing protein [Litorilituus sediminis]QBG34926.1 hypothetical protein EMK97_03835 [Litorilituus sediminis]
MLLGSAVKGVGKVIVKNANGAITLAATTLRKLGKGDPIAYIKNIDWQGLAKEGSALITEKIIALRDALNSITDSWVLKATLSDEAIASLTKHSKQLSEVLPKIEDGIAKAAKVLEAKTNKALDEYTGELAHAGKTGDVKKVKTDELDPPKGKKLPGASPKPIIMKKHNPPCFTPGPDLAKNFKGGKQALEKEFYKQLKAQQAGINKMTVGQYLNNRKTLQQLTVEHGHDKARKILTNGGAAQTSARKELEALMLISIRRSLKKQNITGLEAKKLAKSKVKEQMSQLAALHDPDLIAGGEDKISKLGDKRVNSSLGSQWSKSDRVSGMDKAAKEAMELKGANAQMNIQLERCK